VTFIEYDPEKHATAREIAEEMGLEYSQRAYNAIRDLAEEYEEETGLTITVQRYGDGVKVWRRMVAWDELRPFAEWYKEIQARRLKFSPPISGDPTPPATPVSRKEIVRNASMKVYERLKKIGEEEGLPGLEEHAFFLLKHEESRSGAGMYNFGLALGDKKEKSQPGD
jgi:hypothetical protein